MASSEVAKENCGTCKKIIGNRDKKLQCEACYDWYHCKCEEVGEEVYQVISKTEGLHWYCHGCNKAVAKIITTLSTLASRQEELEKSVVDTQNRLANIQKRVELQETEKNKIFNAVNDIDARIDTFSKETKKNLNTIEVRINKIEEQLEKKEIEGLTKAFINDGTWADIVKKEIDVKMKNVTDGINQANKAVEETRKIADNEREREMRKRNVVIFNIKEDDDAGDWKAQKDSDMKYICEMFAHIIEDTFNESEI